MLKLPVAYTVHALYTLSMAYYLFLYITFRSTHLTESVCRESNTKTHLAAPTSHTRAVLSDEPDTMVLPGKKKNKLTYPLNELRSKYM